jgi:hypothetical protein
MKKWRKSITVTARMSAGDGALNANLVLGPALVEWKLNSAAFHCTRRWERHIGGAKTGRGYGLQYFDRTKYSPILVKPKCRTVLGGAGDATFHVLMAGYAALSPKIQGRARAVIRYP